MLLMSYGDDSAKIKGIQSPYVNLGLGKRYVDTFSKFEALREFLESTQMSDTDLICFVDGYDVVQKRAWFVHFNGKSHLGVGADGSSFCVLERYIRGETIGGLRQMHRTLEEQ